MTNRWIASYDCLTISDDTLEHYGRIGMKWYQHIFGKDPSKGRRKIDSKRKQLAANVSLARDAARRGNVKQLNKLNAKTKKMTADIKQLEDIYEQATGQKYSSGSNTNSAEVEKQHREETKQTILKTGSAKDVFAIKDQLTQSEMQDAINRIQKENSLAALKNSELQQKIDNARNFTNTVINAGNTAVNAFITYENVAKMVNSITGNDSLPVFTGRKEKASKEAEYARAKKVKSIIESSDPQLIADNIHLFTNDEVQKAKQRLDNIQNIKKQIKPVTTKKEKTKETKETKKEKTASTSIMEDIFPASVKKDSKEAVSVSKIVEDALRDYERSTRGKGKATAETYGLDRILTPSAEEKASKWIDAFMDFEKGLKHSDLSEDELYHHGIPNQKWGEKNGPPYPLDKQTHNRVISSKTKSFSKDTSSDDEEFKVGVTHLTAPGERFYRESIEASDLSRIMNVAEGIESGELSHLKRLERPNGKIISGDVADVNYARNHMGKSDPQWLKEQYSFLSKDDRVKLEEQGVELQFGNTITDPGLNNNCAKCSASLFLRSLGYDVQAGRSAHGALSTAGQYWFDNAVPYKEKSMENLERRMASFGHQGKGMLGCRRADGSGHSIYFQNEKNDDGKWETKIYDGQIGKRYDSVKELFEAESFDDTQFSTITNLTNATPNWEHLAEDSVSRVNYSNKNMNVVQDIRTGKSWLADNFKYT